MTSPATLRITRTDRGRRFTISRRIPVPPNEAWQLLSEVRHWPDWGPLVTGVDYAHDAVRPGTSGRIQLMKIFSIPFRIQQVKKYKWTWTVCGLTPPADGHRVEPLDGEECRVSFELPIWAAVYLPICYAALRLIDRMLSEPD